MLDETEFTAQNHLELLEDILARYGKSVQNVLCLIGDNCATNVALAHLAGVPLIGMNSRRLWLNLQLGCASHRFNLQVKKFFIEQEPLLAKVGQLMSKLNTLKISGMPRSDRLQFEV
jgi:hypothetical protein